jgi:hypothetical protein
MIKFRLGPLIPQTQRKVGHYANDGPPLAMFVFRYRPLRTLSFGYIAWGLVLTPESSSTSARYCTSIRACTGRVVTDARGRERPAERGSQE